MAEKKPNTKTEIQRGLYSLMCAAVTYATTYAEGQKGGDNFRFPTVLDRHPFDLKIPEVTIKNTMGRMKDSAVKYVGWPAYTDSHRWLVYFITEAIRQGSFNVTHLRRIVAHEIPAGRPDLAGDYIFFEIGFHGDTWIAGGCLTGHDQHTVDEPFTLLSQIWGVKIEEVNLSPDMWDGNELADCLRAQQKKQFAS